MAFTAYQPQSGNDGVLKHMTLEIAIEKIRNQFTDHPPNGWLLGWDERRHLESVRQACIPFLVTNTTSFDYSFCNRFEARLDDKENGGFWVLTIRLSFVLPMYALHWTKYEIETEGTVAKTARTEHREIENRVRMALDLTGLVELPDEWSEQVVGGVELELSGATNVTISKCLFEDYAG